MYIGHDEISKVGLGWGARAHPMLIIKDFATKLSLFEIFFGGPVV